MNTGPKNSPDRGGVSPAAASGGSAATDTPGLPPRGGVSTSGDETTSRACAADPPALPAIARTNADTLGHRSSGFLDSARASAGRSAAGLGSRFGGRFMCCMSNWLMLPPSNGRCPVSNSWYTHARLYWSQNRVMTPSNVSGAAYTGVMPPVTVAISPCRSFTCPKSATFTWL